MSNELACESIVSAIQGLLKPHSVGIALHEPVFQGNEWNYVKECLDTGWVSSAGRFVERFEHDLMEITGAKSAVATVNGTAALHICLLLAGVTRDDEVIVPTLTFIATANAVTYCGAIPHFADSEERTLGLDPVKLDQYLKNIADIKDGQCYNRRTGRRMKAVVPMHVFGHPVDLDPLCEVCNRYHLVLIEDAAEAIGSSYKGRHVGNDGLLSVLSFNGNKTVTTGGGGAILTNDVQLGAMAKHMTTTAKRKHQWAFYHDMVGYNYRLPNLNAALGCAQLEQLPDFVRRKRALAERYVQALSGIEGIQIFTEPSFAYSNYWLNVLLLKEKNAEKRDDLLQKMHDSAIFSRPAWVLMHKLPIFELFPRMDLSVAESLERRIINLPSSVFL